MNLKKMILGVVALASLASGLVHASEGDRNREMRWDFQCQFERQGSGSCEAFASIYTRRDLDGRDHGGGGPGVQWSNMNRFAVFCDRGGLIYADGASVRFHHDNLIISAANGGRPRLVLELPLGENHHGGGRMEREHSEARLILPNGDELHGQCEYDSHDLH